MFQCMIPCTKPTVVDRDEDARGNGTPNTKEAVKSLTSQFKDLALKLSGKQSKAGSSGSIKYETFSEEVPYAYIGGESEGSTPPRGNTTPGGGREPEPPAGAVVLVDLTGTNEWIAQMQPGVHITFVALPTGGNDLKRIRFSRDMFDKWKAQRWWADNYDRIRELYNVQTFNRRVFNNTPAGSDDDENSVPSDPDSPTASWLNMGNMGYFPAEAFHATAGQLFHGGGSSSANNPTGGELANDMEAEWVEQDEHGVFVTIKRSANGTREIRRVRFSRQVFDEDAAKNWWLRNKERVHAQYI